MDVRSGVGDLIARDVVLDAVRVTHTDRGGIDLASTTSRFGACSIVMEWSVNDQSGAPAGSHLLTVWANLPRQRSSEHLFLDFLLQRVREVLLAGAADGSIISMYRGTSRGVVASSVETISKHNKFEVTPQQPRRAGMALLNLAPWEGADSDAPRYGARSGAAQTPN
ncbi:hypothetical protein ACQPZA_27130 [Pseudonocardia xinjiangensis]|uniref:Uncharacterized protein n=1 Tax=Pseudonocardia xinjiangensis TaxID=75289 RepID=A0ABX1RDX3_9PSEU|nr:hypothetical protein [Pseudonocardia xinjiangensis]NMH77438.1 hypothetical protein [Pseudonocardia xinjiangensis]